MTKGQVLGHHVNMGRKKNTLNRTKHREQHDVTNIKKALFLVFIGFFHFNLYFIFTKMI